MRPALGSKAVVCQYVATRQTAGAANATINRELAALKRMFTLAIQAGQLHGKPYIPMLRENNTRRGFFEAEQFASDLAANDRADKAAVAIDLAPDDTDVLAEHQGREILFRHLAERLARLGRIPELPRGKMAEVAYSSFAFFSRSAIF